uniref:Uncharacterized protein n=1 Tax=Schizaphis graminum TaxID=13262 RepID=A0A2S2NVC6_SCHGA
MFFFRNGFRSVDFHREISRRRYNNNIMLYAAVVPTAGVVRSLKYFIRFFRNRTPCDDIRRTYRNSLGRHEKKNRMPPPQILRFVPAVRLHYLYSCTAVDRRKPHVSALLQQPLQYARSLRL